MLLGLFARRVLVKKPLKSAIGNFIAVTSRCSFSTSISRLADLNVEIKRGHPVISIPLPTNNETCEFTLYGGHSVKTFTEDIKDEDENIKEALVQSLDGNRVAQTTRMSALLSEGFKLKINDELHVVQPSSEVSSLVQNEPFENVKDLVEKLYISLDVGDKKMQTEQQLIDELEKVQDELEPLEVKRQELEKGVETRTNVFVWGGLAFMAVQFGFLARLTWWEYSWDIMEPVTYFVTYATSMACYAYFVLTRQEYLFPEARNRQFLISFHKKAKRHGFDIEKYNSLRETIAKIEAQLEELHQPIKPSNE